MWTSSALSISSSIPVILPARSGNMRWINGKSLSPSICFCSCGGAAASIVAVRGSWPWTSTACCGGGAPPGATICPGITWAGGLRAVGVYLKLLLRADLGTNHGHGRHAWPGHHGHRLRSGLGHRPRLLLTNSGSSNPWSARSNPTSHPHSGHASRPWHRLLLWPTGLGTDLGRSEESLGLGHRGHEVASHAHLLHTTH